MAHGLAWCEDLKWFPPTREKMAVLWNTECESFVGHACDECCADIFSDVIDVSKGHVSIACSLVAEQQQISDLLASSGFDRNPVFFFRQLVFLLDEFTERIRQCYELLGQKNAPRQPKSISLWANRYAKHRLALFIQHHAIHIFADENGPYSYLKGSGSGTTACLRSGYVDEPVTVIDEEWFEKTPKPDLSSINQKAVPAVLIPNLSIFIQDAIDYYRDFVAFAKLHPQELEKFQSNYHWPITQDMEEEIKRIFEIEESTEGEEA